MYQCAHCPLKGICLYANPKVQNYQVQLKKLMKEGKINIYSNIDICGTIVSTKKDAHYSDDGSFRVCRLERSLDKKRIVIEIVQPKYTDLEIDISLIQRMLISKLFHLVIYKINKSSLRKQIYEIIDLLEMGKNLVIYLPEERSLGKRLEKRLRVNSLENFNEISSFLDQIIKFAAKPISNIFLIRYPNEIEIALNKIIDKIISIPLYSSRRWLALKIIEEDQATIEKIIQYLGAQVIPEFKTIIGKLWVELGRHPKQIIMETKYRLIDEIAKEI